MLSRYEKVNKIKSTFLRPTADNRINLTMDKILPLNCNTYFYFRRKHTEKKKAYMLSGNSIGSWRKYIDFNERSTLCSTKILKPVMRERSQEIIYHTTVVSWIRFL